MKHYLLAVLVGSIALSCQPDTKKDTEAKIGVIEVVTFMVNSGISENEARQKLSLLNDLVRGYEGFIDRKISINENGQWIDIVYWTSKDLAHQAAKDIMSHARAHEVFSIIDESSIEINYYELVHSNL